MKFRRLSASVLTLAAAIAILASCSTLPRAGVDRIRRVTLAKTGLSPGLGDYRIAFVSDIHLGNNFSGERLSRLIAAVNAEKPDCIILGGDLTLGTSDIDRFAEAARRFSATEGVYAVLGNHDYFNGRARTTGRLREAGIVVLDETLIETPRGLTLVGINDFQDIYPLMSRLRGTIESRRKDGSRFTVLASHNPYFALREHLEGFDLMLSGHTHGGQIAFFGWAPALGSGAARRYRTGTVYTDGVPVIISNGAGFGGEGLLRFRFGAPSDFLLITLEPNAPR